VRKKKKTCHLDLDLDLDHLDLDLDLDLDQMFFKRSDLTQSLFFFCFLSPLQTKGFRFHPLTGISSRIRRCQVIMPTFAPVADPTTTSSFVDRAEIEPWEFTSSSSATTAETQKSK